MHLPLKTSNLCNITLAAKVYTLQHQVRPQNPLNWFCCWWCRACSSVAVGLRLSVPMKLLLHEKCMPLSAMSICDFSYNEIWKQAILSFRNEGIHVIQTWLWTATVHHSAAAQQESSFCSRSTRESQLINKRVQYLQLSSLNLTRGDGKPRGCWELWCGCSTPQWRGSTAQPAEWSGSGASDATSAALDCRPVGTAQTHEKKGEMSH